MPVRNPLYRRCTGEHPEHGHISIDRLTSVLFEWADGVYGTPTSQQAIDTAQGLIVHISNPHEQTGLHVGLDATELQQARDLVDSVIGQGSVAARAERRLKMQRVIVLLESRAPGYGPDDMTGTVVNGAAGGKLNVPRRDSP